MRHIAPKPFSWKLPNSVGFRYGRERRSQAKKNCRKCQDNAARGRKNRSASRQDSEARRKSIPRASSRSREARPPRLSGREHRAPARSPDRGRRRSQPPIIYELSAEPPHSKSPPPAYRPRANSLEFLGRSRSTSERVRSSRRPPLRVRFLLPDSDSDSSHDSRRRLGRHTRHPGQTYGRYGMEQDGMPLAWRWRNRSADRGSGREVSSSHLAELDTERHNPAFGSPQELTG